VVRYFALHLWLHCHGLHDEPDGYGLGKRFWSAVAEPLRV
jgi:hypothetical protein